ncbi:hypothetical protein ACIQMV_08665 [Streptomyces sp. NPDC091412]|uniref:hypothetical protein n=1 Tax=Streptomyces sp. NPDC091412 TaxID=3366002 RepID=UPI00381D975B
MSSTTATPAPTAPLPSSSLLAMRRLDLALTLPVSPAVVRAVTEYETAAVHAKDLAAVAESGRMSDLDADSLAAAEDLMAGARETLTAAGWLELIEAVS